MKNPRNVLDVQNTTFLHYRAPCMSALATMNLLKTMGLTFSETLSGQDPRLI